MAFNSPELRVLGLTTVYGNVPTSLATQNALRLVEMAGKAPANGDGRDHNNPNGPDGHDSKCVEVAQGAARSLRAGTDEERIADFVHGADGFGDVGLPPPKGHAADCSAAEFIVRTVHAHPGRVTVLALAPLTNIAQALMLDPQLGDKWAELVVLGGAFFVSGNVNPAAEANIFGDPDAADLVLGAPRVRVVGLDVTTRCRMTGQQLEELRGQGQHGTFVADMSRFYLDFHRKYYAMDAIHLHDPTALVAVLRPELFTWHSGAVRVAVEGVTRGQTVVDVSPRGFHGHNGWTDRPRVQVALGVDSDAVVGLIRERLAA